MGELLYRKGYRVTLVLDCSLEALLAAIDGFQMTLHPGCTAVVYFSGHGESEGGQNFLLPSDASTCGEVPVSPWIVFATMPDSAYSYTPSLHLCALGVQARRPSILTPASVWTDCFPKFLVDRQLYQSLCASFWTPAATYAPPIKPWIPNL
jgi:hypothetical protein